MVYLVDFLTKYIVYSMSHLIFYQFYRIDAFPGLCWLEVETTMTLSAFK